MTGHDFWVLNYFLDNGDSLPLTQVQCLSISRVSFALTFRQDSELSTTSQNVPTKGHLFTLDLGFSRLESRITWSGVPSYWHVLRCFGQSPYHQIVRVPTSSRIHPVHINMEEYASVRATMIKKSKKCTI